MGIKTGVLLLLTVTTACGLSTSLNCTQITHQTTLLQHFQHCKVTIEDGYVNAICNILVGLPLRQKFIPADPETLTMEQHLVSDTPVDRMTPNDGTVCLSLRSVKIKKWDNFPPEMAQQYDMFLTNEDSIFGPFNIYSLLIYIRQMTFQTNFGKPPQVAAAICNGTRNDGSCNFDVYGFVDRYRHKFTSGRYLNIIVTFVKYWNIYSAETDAVNITFSDTVKKIPKELFWDVAITPIRHFLFYKCNFDSIGEGEIPHLRKLDSLEFFQTPIKKVHPLAFDVIPDLRHASLIGTKLPGIPAAIFSLTRLDTLDMSNTDVPRDTEFQYCPGSCEENSSVQRLILSGTNLSSLPDRAFCGFPFLRSLEIDNCHITQLSGSPFICLGNLSNLHMPGNKIKSLDGENVKGLKNLLFLDLNRNRIAQFEGPQIFSNLISLRRLILSQNEIKELQLGTVEYVPIEQLNLVYNRISKWKPPLFARMGNLKTLLLEHNVLSRISDDMLHDISHVSYVNVSWNPWDCSSCQLENLLSLLHKHPMQCKSCLFCKEPDEHEGWLVLEVPWNENDCAPPDHYRIYGIPVLLSIMVSSVVAYIVYRNRWYCMYGLLYLKVVIKGYRRHTHAGRFLWDGFLSYHASDAEWVRDVLLPKLESAPMKFRLCVAERDFIPGLPITENICRAITQSRVSLFVISREFCRSRWCMFELSLAQHRLFENDRHDGMVFIRKNDVDESEMSSMLVYLIKSRTYVQLPPVDSSEALSNLFWLQVQAALEQ